MNKKTKNQHFVPQLLLKNFANSQGLVSIYDSRRDILRPPTTVNRVLAENYLYDQDNSVEHFLRDHVEGPVSPIFDKLVSNPRNLFVKPELDILRFVAVQLNRTPNALSQVTEIFQKFAGTVFQRVGELNGFDIEATKRLKVSLTNKRSLLARQTVEGVLNWPLLEDLSCHLLINETAEKFVISDHPVVHYNWYLRDANHPAHASLTSRGLQIFLPLSHTVTLCLYDKSIYKMGERGNNYSVLNSMDDVRILNNLQLRNRMSYVVFTESESGIQIKSQCLKVDSGSLYSNHAWSSDPQDISEDKLKTTHVVWRTQAKLNDWLSVSKVHRRVRKRPVACYERKPEVVEAHKLFVENARRRSSSF